MAYIKVNLYLYILLYNKDKENAIEMLKIGFLPRKSTLIESWNCFLACSVVGLFLVAKLLYKRKCPSVSPYVNHV